eukprot:comp5611_c0_seq1/m.1514 comp5611_c0_seq1/g.1514  ORF comp5611_c0_seq1/g.1514 comp5611_c0_seq1/m.1514 type:complete len:244 (-) comp5611_c0_seq1:406-1137(-)
MAVTDTCEEGVVSRVGPYGTTLTFGHNNRKSKNLDSPKLAKGPAFMSRQTLYYDALDQLDSEEPTVTADTHTARHDKAPERNVLQEEEEAGDDYLARSAAVRERLARSLLKLDALSSEQTKVYTQLKTSLAAATASQEQLATVVAGMGTEQQHQPSAEATLSVPDKQAKPKSSKTSFAVTLLRTPSRVLKHFRNRKHASTDQSAQAGGSSGQPLPAAVPTVIVVPPSENSLDGHRRTSPAYDV